MVTSAPFYSGKALDVRYRVPFGMLVSLIILFVVVSSDPPVVLFGLFVCYALSGLMTWVYQKIRHLLSSKP
jgi:CDP-diacylglycerol--serine O-phosphatidyltransferase